jgi:hypothetical protein
VTSSADAVLLAGYAAAVPFTAFVPGFLRMWRRREPWAFALAQGGAVLVVAGWAAKGNVPAAVVNAGWVVGLTAAFLAEGRKRAAA